MTATIADTTVKTPQPSQEKLVAAARDLISRGIPVDVLRLGPYGEQMYGALTPEELAVAGMDAVWETRPRP